MRKLGWSRKRFYRFVVRIVTYVFWRVVSCLAVCWSVMTRQELRIQVRTLVVQIGHKPLPGVRLSMYVARAYELNSTQLPSPNRWWISLLDISRDRELAIMKNRVVNRGRINIRVFTPWPRHLDNRVPLSGFFLVRGPAMIEFWRSTPVGTA